MDNLKILKLLDQVENKMEQLYHHLGEVFAAAPGAAELFRRLENDEISHSTTIQFEIRMLASSRERFEEIDVDDQQIREILDRAQQFLSAANHPSLENAIQLAAELESSESKLSLINHISKNKPKLTNLMNKIVKFDQEHCQIISEFAGNRGIEL